MYSVNGVVQLGTAPFDPRFPATNQAKHCYTRYNEYYKCVKEKGDPEDPECIKYKRWYKSLCPTEWVRSPLFSQFEYEEPGLISPCSISSFFRAQIEAWEEQRENGTWPGKY